MAAWANARPIFCTGRADATAALPRRPGSFSAAQAHRRLTVEC